MKFPKLKTLMLLALGAAAAFQPSAAQAATHANGDLFLGVRASGGVNSNLNYVLDLGPASAFENYTTIQTLNLGDVGSDLGSLFGGAATNSPWYNRSTLLWGIIGTSGVSGTPSDPAKTLFASNPQLSPGTQSAPWRRDVSTNQGLPNSLIIAMATAYDSGSTTSPTIVAPTAVTEDSNATANSWSTYQPGGTNSPGGGAFQNFLPSIEGSFASGAAASILDLYRIKPGDGDGDYLGLFFFNNSGQLTFVPKAAIGVGNIDFASTTLSVAESASPLVVTINRTGDPTLPCSVEVSTVAVTAVDGQDFTGFSGQVVSFAANEIQKTINVIIANRHGAAGDRTFKLSFANASQGITAGLDATVNITAQITPSVIQFSSATFTAHQADPSVDVTLTRTGGTSAVSALISTSPDSATDPHDFSGFSNVTVSFATGVNTATKTITLSQPAGGQSNKAFSLALSSPSPSANASLGTPATATVNILATDTSAPSVSISSPLPGATITASTVTLSGYANDDLQVAGVQVSLNGHAPVDATVSPKVLLGYPWSITPTLAQGLQGGLNNVVVISKDAAGNPSPAALRSFTFVETGALQVRNKVGNNFTDAGGTVTGALVPPKVYTVGRAYPLVAKPAAGFVFDHWVIPGVASTNPITQVAALNLVYTDDILASPTITAVFAANPFIASKIGAFNGLVLAHKSTGVNDPVATSVASNSTTGFVNLTVMPNGTFSGMLKIDGLSLSISGLFDLSGTARFGPARSDKVLVPRVTKSAVELMLHLDLAGTSAQVTGTVKQYLRTTLISTSDVVADRANFDARVLPFSTSYSRYLVNRGIFNVVLPAKPQTNGLQSTDYPQGAGFGTVTLSASGVAAFSITLADSTVVTASAPLSKNLQVPVYAPLYLNKTGSFTGLLSLDDSLADSDMKALNCLWFRPWSGEQYYPWGWDEGVSIDLFGSKYQSTGLSTSVLAGLGSIASPNAVLSFSGQSLPTAVTKKVNVSATNVVTKFEVADKSFNLLLTPGTGKVTGFFPDSTGAPTFQGLIIQKGTAASVLPGAYGYFKTITTKPVDGTGSIGLITLKPAVP